MMVFGAELALVALVSGPVVSADAFLRQRPDLRKAAGSSACVAAAAVAALGWEVKADLNRDAKGDVAFVVRSSRKPFRYGIVALHSGPEVQTHWVVPLTEEPITGAGLYADPFGAWLLVGRCQPSPTQSFVWTGRHYEETGIHE
jgi:hypothetical protein